MKMMKYLPCALLLVTLLFGCTRPTVYPYSQVEEKYEALIKKQHSENYTLDQEYYEACADLFQSIAHGSIEEQDKFAELTRKIVDYGVSFDDEEVFDIAQDYATVFSRYAAGDRDEGVQELKIKSISNSVARLDFSYWGVMWYSVEMVQMGEQWVTGEFTDPYEGELGKYLMLVRFNDAEPSMKFLEQYSGRTDHKLRISRWGSNHEMTMRIIGNTDHGYNVYIGSDEPFRVEEQSSVRLNRLIGTVSVELHFEE